MFRIKRQRERERKFEKIQFKFLHYSKYNQMQLEMIAYALRAVTLHHVNV